MITTFKKIEKELKKDMEITKTVISSGTELEAVLFKSSGNITINGMFKGKLESAAATEILTEGVVVGDITSNDAIISGNVKGIINCSGFLEVTQTANIEGDIVASSIEIEHGAIINGSVSINPRQNNVYANSYTDAGLTLIK